MAVRIENQRTQNAHSSEVIAAAKLVKVIKNNGNVALLAKSGCGLGKPPLLRGEQPILTNELTPVEVQIVIHIVGAEFGGQLGRRKLRQRFHLITAAADLIKENIVILPYPALGIIAIRQDNDSEAVCIHLPFRGPCKISLPTSQSCPSGFFTITWHRGSFRRLICSIPSSSWLLGSDSSAMCPHASEIGSGSAPP